VLELHFVRWDPQEVTFNDYSKIGLTKGKGEKTKK
jgi:hypothetical protein